MEVYYKPSDIVWVKLGTFWWPGEVVDKSTVPELLIESLKKDPIAIVKYFDDDGYYEVVKTPERIFPYNCERKHDFIKKGMDAFRAKNPKMTSFPKDVSAAEIKTGGNANILSDPMFTMERKRNYAAEIFGTPNVKKPRESNKGRAIKSDPIITHRRFLGYDDYEARILIQSPEQTLQEEEPAEGPCKKFICPVCQFTTDRLGILMKHTSCHMKDVSFTSRQPMKKPQKRKRRKALSDDDFSDDEKRTKTKRKYTKKKSDETLLADDEKSANDTTVADKDKAKRKPKKKSTQPTMEEKKDICTDIIADWDDESNQDGTTEVNATVDSTLNVSTEKPDAVREDSTFVDSSFALDLSESDDLQSTRITEELTADKLTEDDKTTEKIANVSCFDFDEEEEDTKIPDAASGRKIPRVIPISEKRNVEFDDALADEYEEKKKKILEESEELAKLTEPSIDVDKEVENMEKTYQSLMESTENIELPDVPNILKNEQNFHSAKTVKYPDKPKVDASELIEAELIDDKAKKSEDKSEEALKIEELVFNERTQIPEVDTLEVNSTLEVNETFPNQSKTIRCDNLKYEQLEEELKQTTKGKRKRKRVYTKKPRKSTRSKHEITEADIDAALLKHQTESVELEEEDSEKTEVPLTVLSPFKGEEQTVEVEIATETEIIEVDLQQNIQENEVSIILNEDITLNKDETQEIQGKEESIPLDTNKILDNDSGHPENIILAEEIIIDEIKDKNEDEDIPQTQLEVEIVAEQPLEVCVEDCPSTESPKTAQEASEITADLIETATGVAETEINHTEDNTADEESLPEPKRRKTTRGYTRSSKSKETFSLGTRRGRSKDVEVLKLEESANTSSSETKNQKDQKRSVPTRKSTRWDRKLSKGDQETSHIETTVDPIEETSPSYEEINDVILGNIERKEKVDHIAESVSAPDSEQKSENNEKTSTNEEHSVPAEVAIEVLSSEQDKVLEQVEEKEIITSTEEVVIPEQNLKESTTENKDIEQSSSAKTTEERTLDHEKDRKLSHRSPRKEKRSSRSNKDHKKDDSSTTEDNSSQRESNRPLRGDKLSHKEENSHRERKRSLRGEDHRSLRTDNSSQKEEKRSLRGDNSSLKEDERSLRADKSSHKEDKRSFRGDNSSLKEDQLSLGADNSSHKEEKRSLRGDNSSFKEDERSLRADKSSHKEDKRSFRGDNSSLKEDQLSLGVDNSSHKEEKRSLRGDNSSLKEDQLSLGAENSSHKEEKRSLRGDNSSYKEDERPLKADKSSHKEEKRSLRGNSSSHRDEERSHKDGKRSLKGDISSHKGTERSLRGDSSSHKDGKRNLRGENSHKEDERSIREDNSSQREDSSSHRSSRSGRRSSRQEKEKKDSSESCKSVRPDESPLKHPKDSSSSRKSGTSRDSHGRKVEFPTKNDQEDESSRRNTRKDRKSSRTDQDSQKNKEVNEHESDDRKDHNLSSRSSRRHGRSSKNYQDSSMLPEEKETKVSSTSNKLDSFSPIKEKAQSSSKKSAKISKPVDPIKALFSSSETIAKTKEQKREELKNIFSFDYDEEELKKRKTYSHKRKSKPVVQEKPTEIVIPPEINTVEVSSETKEVLSVDSTEHEDQTKECKIDKTVIESCSLNIDTTTDVDQQLVISESESSKEGCHQIIEEIVGPKEATAEEITSVPDEKEAVIISEVPSTEINQEIAEFKDNNVTEVVIETEVISDNQNDQFIEVVEDKTTEVIHDDKLNKDSELESKIKVNEGPSTDTTEKKEVTKKSPRTKKPRKPSRWDQKEKTDVSTNQEQKKDLLDTEKSKEENRFQPGEVEPVKETKENQLQILEAEPPKETIESQLQVLEAEPPKETIESQLQILEDEPPKETIESQLQVLEAEPPKETIESQLKILEAEPPKETIESQLQILEAEPPKETIESQLQILEAELPNETIESQLQILETEPPKETIESQLQILEAEPPKETIESQRQVLEYEPKQESKMGSDNSELNLGIDETSQKEMNDIFSKKESSDLAEKNAAQIELIFGSSPLPGLSENNIFIEKKEKLETVDEKQEPTLPSEEKNTILSDDFSHNSSFEKTNDLLESVESQVARITHYEEPVPKEEKSVSIFDTPEKHEKPVQQELDSLEDKIDVEDSASSITISSKPEESCNYKPETSATSAPKTKKTYLLSEQAKTVDKSSEIINETSTCNQDPPTPSKSTEKTNEIATKLTNPKKRFVKSFEDFELNKQKEKSLEAEKSNKTEVKTETSSSLMVGKSPIAFKLKKQFLSKISSIFDEADEKKETKILPKLKPAKHDRFLKKKDPPILGKTDAASSCKESPVPQTKTEAENPVVTDVVSEIDIVSTDTKSEDAEIAPSENLCEETCQPNVLEIENLSTTDLPVSEVEVASVNSFFGDSTEESDELKTVIPAESAVQQDDQIDVSKTEIITTNFPLNEDKKEETEYVSIDGNLTVVSEKELAEGQVEITASMPSKKPMTLLNFSMDFSDDSTDASFEAFKNEKIQGIAESLDHKNVEEEKKRHEQKLVDTEKEKNIENEENKLIGCEEKKEDVDIKPTEEVVANKEKLLETKLNLTNDFEIESTSSTTSTILDKTDNKKEEIHDISIEDILKSSIPFEKQKDLPIGAKDVVDNDLFSILNEHDKITSKTPSESVMTKSKAKDPEKPGSSKKSDRKTQHCKAEEIPKVNEPLVIYNTAKSSTVTDMCDLEDHIPSQIVCTKNALINEEVMKVAGINNELNKDTNIQNAEPQMSKLLSRLTTDKKEDPISKSRGIETEVKPKELELKTTKLEPSASKNLLKAAIKSKSMANTNVAYPPKSVNKAIILSEKIIRPARESTGSAGLGLKRTYEDVEDIEPYVITKTPKLEAKKDETSVSGTQKILSSSLSKLGVNSQKQFVYNAANKQLVSIKKSSGKAKILNQTIIRPAGESIQTKALTEDNVDFDINSMPIVLSDELLTPETLENIPIVLGEQAQKPGENMKIVIEKKAQNNSKLVAKTAAMSPASIVNSPTVRMPIVKRTTPKILQTPKPTQKIIRQLTPSVSTKSAKFVVVSDSTTRQGQMVKKQTNVVRKTVPATSATSSTLSNASESTGHKIMIFTNQQGKQQRLLLTPAQQKLFSMQVAGKTVMKSASAAQKSQLVKVQNSSLASTSKLPGQSVHSPKVVKTAVGNAVATTPQMKIVPPRKAQKVFMTGNQTAKPLQQKTILITNQHGQTVRKIQGTNEALLDKQVAEQLEAIKVSSMKAQQKQHEVTARAGIANKPVQGTIRKPVVKRSDPKQTVIAQTKSYNPATTTISGSSRFTEQHHVPPLTPIKQDRKSEEVLKQATQTKPAQAKPERPLHQLVIQDNAGNQTTITEGQILALPSETVDGQPQSYMLVTLDETGNLTPLNNEALMSLDPSLAGLSGGDLSNMVLQMDAGASKGNLSQTAQLQAAPTIVQEKPKQEIQQPIAPPKPVEQIVAPMEQPAAQVQVTCNINGEPGQQIILTGDPAATQKFLDSLSDGSTDLANILAGAEGNSFLIQADGQQILINTEPTETPLLRHHTNLPEQPEQRSPMFSTHPVKNQDILAAALADTDVFQQDQISNQGKLSHSQLSPGQTLFPMNVGNVLETSLTLNSPIMTPLEVPSTNSKRIPDEEADILTTHVPKNVDLPITITDPNISQTVSHQQVLMASDLQSNLELSLPISETNMCVTSGMNSPSFVYSLPSLDVSEHAEINQKTFSSSMPLLTEDIEESPAFAPLPPKVGEIHRSLPLSRSDSSVVTTKNQDDKHGIVQSMSSTRMMTTGGRFIEEGLCTLGAEMCSSLSEPPPEMFDIPMESDGLNFLNKSQNESKEKSGLLVDDNSLEIPVQSQIGVEFKDSSQSSDSSSSVSQDKTL